jgi:hypothetical protein
MTAVSAPTVASWTSRGRNTVLDEPRPVDVVHNGAWFRGDLTATRYEPDAGWWGFAHYVVGVGRMLWNWKHESELRRTD